MTAPCTMRLCLFFSFLIVASTIDPSKLHSQVISITVEEFYSDDGSVIGYPAGHNTYRIYANTQNATDRVIKVCGDHDNPLSLSVTGSGIWNSPVGGGVLGDATPCILFDNPSTAIAEFDSYITIGINCNNDGAANPIYKAEDIANPWQNQAFATAPYGSGEFVVNTPVGGTWFVLPENASSQAGSDLKVMLAQITTDGDVCGTFNLQVFANYAGPGSGTLNQTFSFGSSSSCVPGCPDSNALNYNPSATYYDGNCLFPCALEITNIDYFNFCDGTDEGTIEITVEGNQGFLEYEVNGVSQGLTADNTFQIYGQSNENLTVLITDTRFNSPSANPNGELCQIEQTFSIDLTAGCTDNTACNFSPAANCDDGTCTYPGCTNAIACNYNVFAGCDDGSCISFGCTNTNACNYNADAGCDDGSCTFSGCTDTDACNFSQFAGCDDGSCIYFGCTNFNACNYNPSAGCNDGTCIYPGCTDVNACNFDPSAGCDDGSCFFAGCTDFFACNYSPNAGCDDGSCNYPGCNNALACNFDGSAGCDDGSCLFTTTPCNDFNANTINDQIGANCMCEGQLLGCTDSDACNFNPQADIDNGTCLIVGTTCNDNNANTMLDQIAANCNCLGTPFNYGSISSGTSNLCPGLIPDEINLSAPLNLLSYAVQWYYQDGAVACPSGNNTAGWTIIAGANTISYSPSEFTGTRTFACLISPSNVYNIPSAWAAGCRTISYYSFNAQAIIGNPNIAPFSSITYAVNPISGHTYNWTVTNGAVTSGQGTSVITILWGQNGPYQVTLNESNGLCSDSSTLLVVNSNCSINVSAISEGGDAFCPGSSATLLAITEATGINYQWYFDGNPINGGNEATLEITAGGNYQVLITQAACSAVSQTLFISTLPAVVLPQLIVTSLSPGCSGGTALVSADGGSFQSFLWSNGETTQSIEVSESGEYSVELADNNGCQATAGPITVNLSLQDPLPICIVSVNQSTNNNIIVWEPLLSEVTSGYTIYKESNEADEYVSIGSVSYGQDGLFEDPNSNASVQASRYRIALLDTCGIESFLTPHHKTIHLTSNLGVNNTVNLIWSHYEGFFFGSYNIYRGTDAGNLSLLATIASNLNSYTDLSPLIGASYYVIEIEGVSCDPTRDVILSRSNIISTNPNSLMYSEQQLLAVYPNPTSAFVRINISTETIGNELVITDITGVALHKEKITHEQMSISLEAYAAGIYFIQLRSEGHVLASRQIVLQ